MQTQSIPYDHQRKLNSVKVCVYTLEGGNTTGVYDPLSKNCVVAPSPDLFGGLR